MDIMIIYNFCVSPAMVVAKHVLIRQQIVGHVIKMIIESSIMENVIVFMGHLS